MPSDNKHKVRFAPSPTGGLHPGNARIAVFNWLYARHNDADMVLRIEDTDLERSTPEFERSIIEDLKWLGIDWDEGPVRQSERRERYSEVLSFLLKEGWLYPCYCSDEELEEERQAQLKSGKPPRYSGKCKGLKPKNAPHVLRFDVEKYSVSRKIRSIGFKDLIKGKELSSSLSVIGDFVLVRRDLSPTYNFAVVVDDSDMGITHVFRGEDHISNTYKQLMLLDVIGAKIPEYGHLPMLLAKDRTKLSKRSGGVPINEYRSMGILPEAVFNHLAFLGGMFQGVDETLERSGLVKAFDPSEAAASSCVYDTDKLYSINSKFIAKRSADETISIMEKEGLSKTSINSLYDSDSVKKIFTLSKEGAKTLKDVAELVDIFIDDGMDETSLMELDPEQINFMLLIIDNVEDMLSDWNAFKNKIKSKTTLSGAKFFKVFRMVLTGKAWGPPLDDIVKIISRDVVVKRAQRIKKAVG